MMISCNHSYMIVGYDMARTKKPDDLQSIFTPPATTPDTASTTVTQSTNRVPSRAGKRGKLVYLNEAAEKRLTNIGTDYDKTQQALMIEAVNLLFEHYGKAPIA